jgi:hypothetical protein
MTEALVWEVVEGCITFNIRFVQGFDARQVFLNPRLVFIILLTRRMGNWYAAK